MAVTLGKHRFPSLWIHPHLPNLAEAVLVADGVQRGTFAREWEGTRIMATPVSTHLVGPSSLCSDWWHKTTGRNFTSRCGNLLQPQNGLKIKLHILSLSETVFTWQPPRGFKLLSYAFFPLPCSILGWRGWHGCSLHEGAPLTETKHIHNVGKRVWTTFQMKRRCILGRRNKELSECSLCKHNHTNRLQLKRPHCIFEHSCTTKQIKVGLPVWAFVGQWYTPSLVCLFSRLTLIVFQSRKLSPYITESNHWGVQTKLHW